MVQHLTVEQEAGLRTGFTEKEREVSAHTIQRQVEVESRQEGALEEEDEDEGKRTVTVSAKRHGSDQMFTLKLLGKRK